MEKVLMQVPMLAVVKIPTLAIDNVDVTFDMEVKSSETAIDKHEMSAEGSGSAGVKVGPFTAQVSVKGSVASHKENTRSSDNSAKYHVEVHASQGELPEGLSRVLDILSSAVTPATITPEPPKTKAA
jgi:hypothetical protein